jgi:hypothetical protein
VLDLKALPVLRKNMDAFIRADPVRISLVRTEKIKTPAGGYISGPATTLAPQQFRIGWFKRRLYDFKQEPAEGKVPVVQYMLIGRHSVDLLAEDEFDYNGDHYMVTAVEPKTNDRSRTDRVVGILRVEVDDPDPPV